jgi:hypothetical protein
MLRDRHARLSGVRGFASKLAVASKFEQLPVNSLVSANVPARGAARSAAPPPYARQVYAFGAVDDESLLWIAMERMQGVSLGDWLEKHGRMPLERFVPFFDHVCEIAALHRQGIPVLFALHAAADPCDAQQAIATLDVGALAWRIPTTTRAPTPCGRPMLRVGDRPRGPA